MSPLPLETERLRLRPATPEDLEAWHAISIDAEQAWFGEATSTLDDTLGRLRRHIAHQASHGFAIWAVELAETGEIIGRAGLNHLEDGPEIEVGYAFLRPRWGHGYATEAARACVAYGFAEMDLEKIVADVEPANEASARVLEKCGFERVGQLDDGRLFYAVTR